MTKCLVCEKQNFILNHIRSLSYTIEVYCVHVGNLKIHLGSKGDKFLAMFTDMYLSVTIWIVSTRHDSLHRDLVVNCCSLSTDWLEIIEMIEEGHERKQWRFLG